MAVLTRWFKLLGFQVVARGGACTCEDVGAVPCRGGWVGGGLSSAGCGVACSGRLLLEVGVGGVIQAPNSDTKVSGGTLHPVTLGRQRAFSGGFCLARSSPGPSLNCPQRGRGGPGSHPGAGVVSAEGTRRKERWMPLCGALALSVAAERCRAQGYDLKCKTAGCRRFLGGDRSGVRGRPVLREEPLSASRAVSPVGSRGPGAVSVAGVSGSVSPLALDSWLVRVPPSCCLKSGP